MEKILRVLLASPDPCEMCLFKTVESKKNSPTTFTSSYKGRWMLAIDLLHPCGNWKEMRLHPHFKSFCKKRRRKTRTLTWVFSKCKYFPRRCKECVNMAIQVCWLMMTKWVVTGERKHLANTSSCKPQIPNWLDGRYRTQMWRLWWNFQKWERCWKSHYGR